MVELEQRGTMGRVLRGHHVTVQGPGIYLHRCWEAGWQGRKNKGHGAVQNETSEMQMKVEEIDRNTEGRN